MLGRWDKMELGLEQLMPLYEDRDYIYFEYLYNNSKRQTKLGVFGKRDGIIQPIVIPKNVYDDSKTSLQIQELKAYEGNKWGGPYFHPKPYASFPYIDKGSDGNYVVLGEMNLNHVNMSRFKSQTENDFWWDIPQSTREPQLYKEKYNKIFVNHRRNGSDRFIVADIKAKKLKVIKDTDGNLGYGLRMSTGKNTGDYQIAFHKITNTYSVGSSKK